MGVIGGGIPWDDYYPIRRPCPSPTPISQKLKGRRAGEKPTVISLSLSTVATGPGEQKKEQALRRWLVWFWEDQVWKKEREKTNILNISTCQALGWVLYLRCLLDCDDAAGVEMTVGTVAQEGPVTDPDVTHKHGGRLGESPVEASATVLFLVFILQGIHWILKKYIFW